MILDTKEIKVLLDNAVDVLKQTKAPSPVQVAMGHTYEPDADYNFFPGYRESCEWSKKIRVHAEKGVFPKELFKNKSPNETDEEYSYRKSNYKQVTLPVAVDFNNTIKRCFHDANYNITWGQENPGIEKSGQTYREYVTEGLPHYGSIENYIKNTVQSLKTIDANAIVCIKPYNLFKGDDGEFLFNEDELIEPIPVHYTSDQIVAYEEEHFYMVMLHEKSMVSEGSIKVKKGHIFEIYDEMNIWRIEQEGKYSDFKFNIKLYFKHGAGRVPCHRTKGIPIDIKEVKLWQSQFLAAVDILDETLLDASNLLIIKSTCIFPYRIMTGDTCEFEMLMGDIMESCNGRGEFYDPETQRTTICPGCNGEGLRNRMSPGGVLLLRPKTLVSDGDSGMDHPGLSYVSPSIETPEFLRREINSGLERARQILHLHTTSSEVSGSIGDVTATESALDMKALYAFVKIESDQLFDLMVFVHEMVGKQRYGDLFESPTITYPQQFDFYTESEYINNISNGIEKGLPGFMIQSSVRKYIESMYFTDEAQSKMYELILLTDRLLHMTTEDIDLKHMKGLIEDWEVVLHDSSLNLVQRLIREHENFFDLPLDKQSELLEKEARDKAKIGKNAMKEAREKAVNPFEIPKKNGENPQ